MEKGGGSGGEVTFIRIRSFFKSVKFIRDKETFFHKNKINCSTQSGSPETKTSLFEMLASVHLMYSEVVCFTV